MSKRYNQIMENELKNLEDHGEMQVEGQTALSRHQISLLEQKKHKENLRKMKRNIKKRGGRFNKNNINGDFFQI